jgi:hypothetical protein
MKTLKNDPEGFGPNPADNPVNQFGEPIKSSDNFFKQADSAKARKASTKLRQDNLSKQSAKRKALRKRMDEMKKTGNIPASPTR